MFDITTVLEHNAWIASVECEAVYSGPAVIGLLETGVYLLIKKRDGSISIHANNLNQPRNYLRSTEIIISHNIIIFHNKKEKLKIKINQIHWYKPIEDLSQHKTILYGTESQLVEKLINNIHDIIPETLGAEIIREYIIPECGPIDVAIFKENKCWLIEAKRKKITKKAVSQLLQYRSHYKEDKEVYQYLVGPEISPSALKWAEENNIKFIELYWDKIPDNFQELLY